MSTSSLFLRSLPVLASLIGTFLDSVSAQSIPVYALDTEYSGTTFFNGWNFYADADPTHGFVTYVDESTASSSGLIQTGSGSARMNVDSTHTYNPNTAYSGVNGLGRPSVRIESQKSWTHGLFIAEIDHMPGGICGTWPAWWTLGSGTWPYNGEIDIIEGANNLAVNTAALHTEGEAKITNGQSDDCQYNGGNTVGCTIVDSNPDSYGTSYNAQGGGTWAMEWTSSAIKIWSFPHGQVPANVNSANPDPTTWGTPAQTFGGSDLNIDSNFKDHRMVFDTTFCGDYAGAVWTSGGCAASTGYSTCAAYVAGNPAAFANAYWQIGYVKVFQQSGSSSSSQSSVPATSRSSSASGRISTTSNGVFTSKGFTTSTTSRASTIAPASLSAQSPSSSSTTISAIPSSRSSLVYSNAYSQHPMATASNPDSASASVTPIPSSSSSASSVSLESAAVRQTSSTNTPSAYASLSYGHREGSTSIASISSDATTSSSVPASIKSSTTTSSVRSSSVFESMEVGPAMTAGQSDRTETYTFGTSRSSYVYDSSYRTESSASQRTGHSESSFSVINHATIPGAFVAVSDSTTSASSQATTSTKSLSTTSTYSVTNGTSASSTFDLAADPTLASETSNPTTSSSSALATATASALVSASTSSSLIPSRTFLTSTSTSTSTSMSASSTGTFSAIPSSVSTSSHSSRPVPISTTSEATTPTTTVESAIDPTSTSSSDLPPTSTAPGVITQSVIPQPATHPSSTNPDASQPEPTLTSAPSTPSTLSETSSSSSSLLLSSSSSSASSSSLFTDSDPSQTTTLPLTSASSEAAPEQTPSPTQTPQSDATNLFSIPHRHNHGHGHWRGVPYTPSSNSGPFARALPDSSPPAPSSPKSTSSPEHSSTSLGGGPRPAGSTSDSKSTYAPEEVKTGEVKRSLPGTIGQTLPPAVRAYSGSSSLAVSSWGVGLVVMMAIFCLV